MVAIIENWAIIVGIVLGVTPVSPETGMAELTVQIERIDPFKDYPMLIQQKPGGSITIRVRPEQLGSFAVDMPITIRVRRGADPNIAFAAPDQAF